SPLQQWLDGHCYDGRALVRFASTFDEQSGWAIIVAAAAACVLDSARDGRPVDMHYVRPIWRSITEGQIATEYLTSDATDIDERPPVPAHTTKELNTH